MSMICPQHNLEAVFKTGVSRKTGSNYAFYACPVRPADNNDQFCQHKFDTPAEAKPAAIQSSQGILSKLEEINGTLSLILAAIKIQMAEGRSRPQQIQQMPPSIINAVPPIEKPFAPYLGAQDQPIRTEDIPF